MVKQSMLRLLGLAEVGGKGNGVESRSLEINPGYANDRGNIKTLFNFKALKLNETNKTNHIDVSVNLKNL